MALRAANTALGVALAVPHHFLDGFCHPRPYEKTFHNWFGGYTPCFLDVVLLGSAHVTAIVLCITRLSYLRSRRSDRYKLQGSAKALHAAGAAACVLALLLTLFQLQGRIAGARLIPEHGRHSVRSHHVDPYEWAGFGLAAVSWGLLAAVFTTELAGSYKPKHTWLRRFPLVLILGAELARFRLVLHLAPAHGYFFWMYVVYCGGLAALAALSLGHWPSREALLLYSPREDGYLPLADAPEGEEDNINPEARANLLSLATFSWMSALMKKGYKQPLEAEDIFGLAPDDRVEVVAKDFRRQWQEELRKPNGPSLAWACWRTVWWLFLTAVPFKLLNDGAQFVGPFFLNKLLDVIEVGGSQVKGYSYATMMLLGLLVGTLCDNQHFQRVVRAGIRLRGVLTHEVFRKILFLTPSARAQFSSGRIFSHVTSDAETIYQLSTSGLGLISSPLRIIGAMGMLYLQLGWASLVALVVLVLMMPIQALLVRQSARLLKQALSQTDERSKLEGEVIGGIDVIKCSAWEDSFWDRIQRVRNTELKILWRTFIIDSTNVFLLNAIPTIVSVSTFTTYILMGHNLTAAKAFTSLSLFTVLRMPLFQLPQLISQVINARVALNRIQAFLAADEQRDIPLQPPVSEGEPAVIVKGEFTWDLASPATLMDMDVTVPAGSFVAIVGPTGSGKSSMLGAALGLMQQVAGDPVEVHGRIAYVPQAAFIYGGATVRDNILFGLPYDEEKYNYAIEVACLIDDLLQMPAGDDTELGERGVNVSGGQKQRIAIARAAYSGADNILLDDPLSALDARVAQQVFQQAVVGAWADKTRVLVTNQLQYARPADRILYMADGRVVESGTYDELMERGGGFAQLMQQTESEGQEEAAEAAAAIPEAEVPEQNGDAPPRPTASSANLAELAKRKEAARRKEEAGAAREGQLTAKERRATGQVSWNIIGVYIRAMGGLPTFLVLVAWFLMAEACRVGATVWLSHWTGVADLPGAHKAMWYLSIYAGISGAQTLLELVRGFSSNFLAVRAARHLHNGMLAKLLRAPMSFFHTNPLGRIINRLTKDTSDVDRYIMGFATMFCRSMLMLSSTIVLIATVTPFALPPLLPILLLFYFIYLYFQATVREVKRLDAITRSPVYTSVGEAIGGLSTIRAYKAENRLIESNGRLIDRNVVMTLVQMSCNRWLSIRLETLGALSAFSAAALAVEQGGAASVVGLSLSYALQITQLTNMTVRLASLAENAFNAVERIHEYSVAPEEPPAEIPGACPDSWPSKGEVVFDHVEMRYRPGLPLVLKGLSVRIPAASKCGVVGRTGAGKSSLINCVFRLMELDSGKITIDGLDISRLGVKQLRSRMAIIPQVPVLFTGSMRDNMDPFGQHSDAEVWAALRRAHLAPIVENSPQGLDMVLSEGGAPLSAGQKQLAALARALLKRSKIIVLDEATANVDVETDALIQATVREEFGSSTLIAIAHRLHTIIDCDLVLVMDNGRCAEADSPAGLLAKHDSIFSGMVHETGGATERFLRSAAMGEVDAAAARRQSVEAGKLRAAETPSIPSAGDGAATCGAVAERAKGAVGMLRAALAALAEEAESHSVRQGDGGEAFKGLDCGENAAHAAQALSEAISVMDEVQLLAKKCARQYGGVSGPSLLTPPATPLGRSIPNVPSFADWHRGDGNGQASTPSSPGSMPPLPEDRRFQSASDSLVTRTASLPPSSAPPRLSATFGERGTIGRADSTAGRAGLQGLRSADSRGDAQRLWRRLRGLQLLGVIGGPRRSSAARSSIEVHEDATSGP